MPKGIYHHSSRTIESIQKQSRTCKERGIGKWMKGKIISDITKEKMRINAKVNPNYGMKGKHHTNKTIQIIRIKNIGIKKPCSKEHRMNLRLATLRYIKKMKGRVFPRVGKNEFKIINGLEKEMGVKFIRQFEVGGYFVDGYCKELNLVVEVNELHHLSESKVKERDIIRQKFIEGILGCKFLIINDYKK